MKKLKISEEALKSIHDDLLGNNPLLCMFAIRKCVLEEIADDETVGIIKSLESSSLVEWNSCKISDCASAALQFLGIQSYSGDSQQVRDMIDTVFYTK